MISDWTIRLVSAYDDRGQWLEDYCASCFVENHLQDAAQAIREKLMQFCPDHQIHWLEDWLEDNDVESLSVIRMLWGSWGIPTWLAKVRAQAFPDWFPAHPQISVEYLGREEACGKCHGEGRVFINDGFHGDGDEVECDECDGCGYVAGVRCDDCGTMV